MATSILARATGSPESIPVYSHPVAHARWCLRLARHCAAEARTARLLGLPDREWLRALQFSRLARSQWLTRARRERGTP